MVLPAKESRAAVSFARLWQHFASVCCRFERLQCPGFSRGDTVICQRIDCQ